MTPLVEETMEASSLVSRFPRDYIPPRKSSTKSVNLQKDAKYPLAEPKIPEGLIVEGDMLGLIPTLKYANHDITDDQVPTTVIATSQRCVEGVQMNCATFLLNQFLIECEEAQDKGIEFHYAWLLILIALSIWREPDDTIFFGVKDKPCLAAQYHNIWHTTHKTRQMNNNVSFYIYKETIRDNIERTPRIPP
jgi:hypothetical protein